MQVATLRAMAVVVLALTACKSPNGRGDASAVKDLEDTQQVNYVPGDNKYFVICREGKLHKGNKNAIVTKEELKDVCEDQASGGGGNLPPPSGGGGGNVGIGADLASCGTLPEKVKALTIAFSPAYSVQQAAVAPAVAKQQLCIGTVNGLKTLAEKSPSLFKFLTGEVSQNPILVLIDVKDAAVAYVAEDFVLTVPSKISEQTVEQVGAALESSNVSLCADNTMKVDKSCWYKLEVNISCAEHCAKLQQVPDQKNITFAGTGGTIAGCSAVAGAWGFGPATDEGGCDPKDIGCSWQNGVAVRCTASATTQEGKHPSRARFCACK